MSDESLAARLRVLLPRVIAWATRESQRILQNGRPLSAQGVVIARTVGVVQPARVRVLEVQAIPSPDDPDLKQVAQEQNLIGPNTAGLTLGYGIFIVQGQLDLRLLSHECRHVHQVEVAGGLEAFLPLYLKQIAEFGYDNALFELDAKQHELNVSPAMGSSHPQKGGPQ
jgi:hypothetical protein